MLIRLAIWICLLAMAPYVFLYAQSQPLFQNVVKSESEPPYRQTESEQREPDKSEDVTPSSLSVDETSIQEPAGGGNTEQRNEKSHPDWWVSPNWWTVWLTGGIFFLLVIHAFIFRRQANANVVAANAAKISAEAAIKIANADRPYLLFKRLIIERESEGDNFLAVRVTFRVKNSGRSPAIITQYEYGFCIFSELPETPDYSLVQQPTTNSSLSAGLELLITLPVSTAIRTRDEWDAICNGRGSLFFFGRISYMDMMNALHTTGFCYAIEVGTLTPMQDGGQAYNYYA